MPNSCLILVPCHSAIVPACEQSLRELERIGYTVWRVPGYAAIDQGRNQMATDALIKGYDELMWVDSDIGFEPHFIDKLRSHKIPIVCGLYPKKNQRELAAHVLPNTKELLLGMDGGLHEITYAGAGFLYTRREVYETIQTRLCLPICNERFGKPMVPFFAPMILDESPGHWYLAEDYAFCERARQCGYRIMADTSLRLYHFGSYAFSWEDACYQQQRYESFKMSFEH